MKDVEFIDSEESGYSGKKKTFAERIKSGMVNWLLSHGWAKTESQATLFIVIFVLVILAAAVAVFFLTPSPYVPPSPAKPSGLINLPPSGR